MTVAGKVLLVLLSPETVDGRLSQAGGNGPQEEEEADSKYTEDSTLTWLHNFGKGDAVKDPRD